MIEKKLEIAINKAFNAAKTDFYEWYGKLPMLLIAMDEKNKNIGMVSDTSNEEQAYILKNALGALGENAEKTLKNFAEIAIHQSERFMPDACSVFISVNEHKNYFLSNIEDTVEIIAFLEYFLLELKRKTLQESKNGRFN